jgi:hypothetical protein
MEEHARLAPSASSIWGPGRCPGSVQMQEAYPEDKESEDAREGTASHWVASCCLESYQAHPESPHPLLPCRSMIGQAAPNGVVITEEMAEAADVYVKDVLGVAQEFGLLRQMRVEQKVMIPRVHAENWGTPDCHIFNPGPMKLYIWDYKYGHRYVDVFENWQMIDYTIGVVDELITSYNIGSAKARGKRGVLLDSEITVVMRIVQPRNYHPDGPIREWEFDASKLRGYANKLQAAAVEALSLTATTKAGPWCRDCTAKRVCATEQMSAFEAMAVVGDMTPWQQTPEQVGVELAILERARSHIDIRVAAKKEEATAMIMAGKSIPGFRTIQGTGRQKWSKPVTEVLLLGELCGVDLKEPAKAITPKKAIDAGVDPTLIAQYSEIPNTGIKLVEDDGSKARKIFGERK